MTLKCIFLRLLPGLLAITLSIFSLQVSADTLKVKEGAPSSYTVVKGDTLWDISGRYLDQPWRWPELWKANPQIANPHLIYPGDVISLYYQDGQPRLAVNRTTQNVKLSPQVRETLIDDAIPVVPIKAIQPFLKNHLRILDKASMDKAPYVVSGEESRILNAVGDRIYAVGLDNSSHKNYQIYHLGDPIHDPDTGKVIAHEGIFVADTMLESPGQPATLKVTASRREIAIGDRLIASSEEQKLSDFYPKAPSNNLQGKILNIIDGVEIAGRYQAVIINLGKADGLSRGDVLSTFAKERAVLDEVTEKPNDTVTIPKERSGTLMIIRPFERLSYGLVMESQLPLRISDEVRTPK